MSLIQPIVLATWSFSKNRFPVFGIMRCRHVPGGSDTEELRHQIAPDGPEGTSALSGHRW
jgi:hypothetical protein